MNILMVAQNDPAGTAISFAKAINRHTEHNCRLITTETRYNFDYEKDLHVPDFTGSEWDLVHQLLKEADIIHFHMLADEYLELGGGIRISQYIPGKKIIHHHHGHPEFRSNPELFREKYKKLGRASLVSTPDLLKLLPEASWIPNLVPLDEPLYTPLPHHGISPSPFIIAHSPTRKDLKNTTELMGAVQNLHSKGYSKKLKLKILEWTPHRQCLEEKRKSHAVFDHMQGYYGVSSLESLAQGKPVIAGLDHWNIRHIKSFTGADQLPWIIARNARELEEKIKYLADHEQVIETIGQQARSFMEIYWNEKRVLERIFNVYDEL